mmetsp:Transcript_10222/g.19405  ORF Transcript_10222/g.19405 Transcript_10222/m.19405 type:complete len:131 (-) Transcript_10222:189-581(-)
MAKTTFFVPVFITLCCSAVLSTAGKQHLGKGKSASNRLWSGSNVTVNGPVPFLGTCDTDEIHCVKVNSLPSDFCTVTGQFNWCADHVGEAWCICGWAYTRYTDAKGTSLNIDCDGTACLPTVQAKGQCTS